MGTVLRTSTLAQRLRVRKIEEIVNLTLLKRTNSKPNPTTKPHLSKKFCLPFYQGHKWETGDAESLSRTGMPYDESKKIFNYENLQNGKLYAVVDLVYAGVNQKVCAEDKVAWKSLIRHAPK